VVERALEIAAPMLGSDKSRGYSLEMICADFQFQQLRLLFGRGRSIDAGVVGHTEFGDRTPLKVSKGLAALSRKRRVADRRPHARPKL
jgi:hypothetical protein